MNNPPREILEGFIFASYITGSQTYEGEMIDMNDKQLREALFSLQKKFGTPTNFIANSCGVSREHLSRWFHNESYVISDCLKTKLKQFAKGEI